MPTFEHVHGRDTHSSLLARIHRAKKETEKKKEERKRKGPSFLSPPLLLGASCLRQPVRKISLRSSGENEPYALPSEKNSAWCRAQGVDARTANPIDPATSAAPHAPHLLAKVRLPAGKPTTLLLADRRWPRLIAEQTGRTQKMCAALGDPHRGKREQPVVRSRVICILL